MISAETRLKKDMQQCIANDMDLNSRYCGLSFENESKEFIQSFLGFKSLKITSNNFELYVEGELNRDYVKEMPNSILERVKKAAWITQQEDMMEQLKRKYSTKEQIRNEIFSGMNELGENFLVQSQKKLNKKYRKCNEYDINKLNAIKRNLLNNFNLKSELVNEEIEVFLNIIEDEIILNQKQISMLVTLLLKELDFITIIPRITTATIDNLYSFSSLKDESQRTQMVLGISLEEK